MRVGCFIIGLLGGGTHRWFFTADAAVIFGVKNNNQIRGCASRLLRFNCARVLVPAESQRAEVDARAAQGCVMSDEALRGLKKEASVVCV